MDELKRHRRAFAFFSWLVKGFIFRLFNFKYDSLKEMDSPYLLMCNHNLELDPVVLGLAAEKHIYFVASEHIMRKGVKTWFLMRYFKPIIHRKGQLGVSTVKEMLRTLKSGCSVCLFPEGNRSFNGLTGPISSSTGKLARSCGVPLVTYRIEGGYLSQPRWSTTLRRGLLQGKLIHVYSPAELKGMTPAQITEAIQRDLHEDAYETEGKVRVKFSGKKLAYGLESAIFVCPACKRLGLRSDESSIMCSCGWHAHYDEYGMLTDNRGQTYTVTELDSIQRSSLKDLVAAHHGSNTPIFEDSVTIRRINPDHSVDSVETGILSAYPDRLVCCGHLFDFNLLEGFAIYSRNSLVIHSPDNEQFEIKGDISFCGLKYIYLYKINKEELK